MKIPRLLLTLFLLIAWANPARGQFSFEPHSRMTDVIVKVHPGAIDVPLNVQATDVTRATVRSSVLGDVLSRHDTVSILRSFPDASPGDTLLVTEFGQPVRLIDRTRIFRFRFPSSVNLDEVVEKLNSVPEVVFAYKVPEYQFDVESESALSITTEPATTGKTPNDTHFASRQWNLHHTGQGHQPPLTDAGRADIRAVEAWDLFTGSTSSRIGIIDSGMRLTHEDLSGRVSGDGHSDNHGTHVGGIAAALTDNLYGIAGVDWHARILSRNIAGFAPETIYDRIISAIQDNAHILNNSWSGTSQDPLVRSAFVAAHNANVLPISTMGNTSQMETRFPAGWWEVMAVGSSNYENRRSQFSTRGPAIEVVAPGGQGAGWGTFNIYSTLSLTDSDYGYSAGTSMAAPHVSGLASLVRGYAQQEHGLTLYHDDLRQIIRRSTDQIRPLDYTYDSEGWNEEVGFGRINAHEALVMVRDNEILHGTATGGTTYSSTDMYNKVFYGAPGLASGVYFVKRHEVRRNVTFPPTPGGHVWARSVNNSGTLGWTLENPNYGQSFTEIVPGTVTSSSATLRTYVYEVWNEVGQYIGFRPAAPSNIRFAYTVLGDIGPPPLTVSVSTSGVLTEGDYGSWTATASGGPSGDHTFRWYTRTEDFGQPTLVRQHTSSSNTDTYGTIVSESFQLSVTVDRGGQSVSSPWQFIFVVPEDCDPQVDICIGTRPGMLAESVIPDAFSIQPNYPNPFNPTTEIRFSLPESARVTMVVVDLLGRELTRLVDGHLEAGHHRVNVNADTWSSGVYLYRIDATGESGERFIETKRMTLMK